jgi:hypothetical protein
VFAFAEEFWKRKDVPVKVRKVINVKNRYLILIVIPFYWLLKKLNLMFK